MLDVCSRIAEGLEAAQEKREIHRDIKPGKVMITPDEEVKILDLGLARIFRHDIADARVEMWGVGPGRASNILGLFVRTLG